MSQTIYPMGSQRACRHFFEMWGHWVFQDSSWLYSVTDCLNINVWGHGDCLHIDVRGHRECPDITEIVWISRRLSEYRCMGSQRVSGYHRDCLDIDVWGHRDCLDINVWGHGVVWISMCGVTEMVWISQRLSGYQCVGSQKLSGYRCVGLRDCLDINVWGHGD